MRRNMFRKSGSRLYVEPAPYIGESTITTSKCGARRRVQLQDPKPTFWHEAECYLHFTHHPMHEHPCQDHL